MAQKIGLVLTGGGARGAYQAGVIRAIQEICAFKENPFQIIAGISAGAITGSWIAARSEDFDTASATMWEAWAGLTLEKIFRTDPMTLFGTGTRWIKDLSMGAWLGGTRSTYLLDTAPLRKLIRDQINFEAIESHLRAGRLHGLAVSATHYHRGDAVTFCHTAQPFELWNRGLRRGVECEITSEHVMASAAIPFFFPPVKLPDGYYGDGGIRMGAPLSPAVHLGADRVLAVGIRAMGMPAHKVQQEQVAISASDIAGTLLNALFFDSLDADLDRMSRINRTLSLMTPEQLAADPDRLRPIPVLAIRPSVDLGSLASEEFKRFPLTLRHLLKGLGASDVRGWELLSYLAFDQVYAKSLLGLGYADAMRDAEKIKRFMFEEAKP